MDPKSGQSARLAPLPPEHSPDLKGEFDAFLKTLGFVPNSVLTMQRKPKLVRAFVAMQAAIWDPASKVDRGLKRLIAHMASRAAQDPYSMAHTASGALHFGITPQKLDAVADYRASPLYGAAEKAALAVAEAAAAVPNAVDDALFAELRRHWDDEEIVEIMATVAMAGFLARWNVTMATPLEAEPRAVGDKFLAARGWAPGRHAG
jgi:alkylhydroperoxidase family enzyme